MSDDGYTPTTDEVRQGYAETADALGGMNLVHAQFTRWLAEHDRQVKAEALREAAEAMRSATGDTGRPWTVAVALVEGSKLRDPDDIHIEGYEVTTTHGWDRFIAARAARIEQGENE